MEEPRRSTLHMEAYDGDGAWVKYILDFKMPSVEKVDEVKKEIINMLRPVMNTAPRGNYTNFDIDQLLWSYDDYWTEYFVYDGNRYNKDIIKLKNMLRMCLKMELSSGKNMALVGMMLQPKQTYVQRLITDTKTKVRRFMSSKKDEEEEENV